MANKIPLAIADLELQLATAVAVGGTSFTLSSATDDDGVALPAGMYCFTIDSGTSNKEYLIGQLNGTAVTSVLSVSRQGVETSGAARAHRVGAPCIVTNFATLQRVADILRGELTLDGASPISYDTAPTLSDGKELATVQYVLDNVAGGTVTFNAQVVTGVNAGETVSAGQLVYLNTTDQEWYLCDADTAASVNGVEVGIALGAGTNGAAISGGVLLRGIRTTSGLTAGAAYYASNTAGGLATSAGTTSLQVGIALSTTVLLFNPREFSIPTASEKAAMTAATSPSSTNQFVTIKSKTGGVKAMVAGATINGATLPVPVYQNKTDNEFYACDANDTAAYKFLGFAISNGTDGAAMDVQFSGLVSGFTGLSEGEKYYVQDTVGTIGTTAGTQEILVGVAVSETELLIQKGSRRAMGAITLSDQGADENTTTQTVTLGFRPGKITAYYYVSDAGSLAFTRGEGTWLNGSYRSTKLRAEVTTTSLDTETDKILNVPNTGGSTTDAYYVTIASVTDTSFDFSILQKLVTPNTIAFYWEAEGEL